MTIDTQKLREALAHPDVNGWSLTAVLVDNDDDVALVGAEVDGEFHEVLTVNTGMYEHPESALPLANYYAAANPATVAALFDHIDAQATEIAEAKGQIEHLDRQNNALREALGWYQEKSKAMASAAISGDRQAMLNLMQEIAVDYGKRARAALSGESNAS